MNADETFATIMMLVEQAPLPVKDEDWVLFNCSPWKGSSEHGLRHIIVKNLPPAHRTHSIGGELYISEIAATIWKNVTGTEP